MSWPWAGSSRARYGALSWPVGPKVSSKPLFSRTMTKTWRTGGRPAAPAALAGVARARRAVRKSSARRIVCLQRAPRPELAPDVEPPVTVHAKVEPPAGGHRPGHERLVAGLDAAGGPGGPPGPPPPPPRPAAPA